MLLDNINDGGGGGGDHLGMSLYITPQKFYLHKESRNSDLITIDRLTHEIELVRRSRDVNPRDVIPSIATRKSIVGIIGVINLLSGPHLLVIKDKDKVGNFLENEPIYRIKTWETLSYNRSHHHLNDEQILKNEEYLVMLGRVLNTPSFYFSSQSDFTQNVGTKSFSKGQPRTQYFWNYSMIEPLMKDVVEIREESLRERGIIPLIHGAVFINQCSINGKFFKWILISRRSSKRVGTRFWARGSDNEGNVANFVETEQIVIHDTSVSSFIQTRGSIPLLWKQTPNLKYMPHPKLIAENEENQQLILDRHFQEQVANYGKQTVLNLINHRGYESELERAFENYVSLSSLNKASSGPSIFYEGFDFHAEGWDRLHSLIQRCSEHQSRFSYYLSTRGNPLMHQTGVFRTNCMDCLDRTNVIQSLIASENLQSVFLNLGIIHEGQHPTHFKDFQSIYKNVWADHADMISMQYAGTGAMKTDFTRTGKRTFQGKLNDGINAGKRYLLNNFSDGIRHDALNLFVGHYDNLDSSSDESLDIRNPSTYKLIHIYPLLALISIALFFSNFAALLFNLSLNYEESNESIMIQLLLWFSSIVVFAYMIYKYGTEFVNKPVLPTSTSNPPSSYYYT